ncbi:MAG: hypothetical protein JNL97_03335, partial [Verrucomicrobiales bacterium]|nr:hypothetical protein [Verrucomicrobiales bacterium]
MNFARSPETPVGPSGDTPAGKQGLAVSFASAGLAGLLAVAFAVSPFAVSPFAAEPTPETSED